MSQLYKKYDAYYSRIRVRVGDRGQSKRKEVYIKLLTDKRSTAKTRNAIVQREENKIRKEIKRGYATKSDLLTMSDSIEWEWIKADGTATSLKIHTLTEYVDSFIKYKQIRKLRPNSISSYTNALNKFIDAVGGNTLVNDIDEGHVTTFIEYMQQSNLKESSIDSHLKGLTAFLKWCELRRYIDKAPYIELFRPVLEDKWLTEEEYNKILNYDNYTDSRFPKMFKLYGETGIRLAEGFKGILTEDDNAIWLAIPNEASKSKKGRTIQLNKEQRDTVLLMQQLWRDKGQTDLHYKYYSRVFRKVCDKLNIPKHKHFHSLRHYYGKVMVTLTGNIYQVSGMMGHSSVSVTEDYYVKGFDMKSTLRDFPSLKHKLNVAPNSLNMAMGGSKGGEDSYQVVI